MLRKWLTIALIGLSFQVFAQQQDPIEESLQEEASSSNYIRDDLFVFLHAGPGRNYRILGSVGACLLYTSPSPRDRQKSRMPSSA